MSVEHPLFVLDGFALLAYFNGEAGMPRVQAVLRDARENRCRAVIPLINLGEVLYITEREVGLPQAQTVLAAVGHQPQCSLQAYARRPPADETPFGTGRSANEKKYSRNSLIRVIRV
ncbi:MAG: hypothetical protein Q8M58_11030 [Anaerolineales bacterium]|nr:hypothetical protein [Anaerolineales bacterium]